ncbi:DNA primase [Plantibacter sp. PA-3-X8]|uniref:DNA primase n=1 Tax=Plantibacter flavus TaxID=150123 RepID=A0A3N2C2B3_9MICO|nr:MULTISPECIES: DNA primase [Plantibacter]AZH83693.1 DNA primase [Plantibacter sp. PA-3-X8]ROR81643.1 DNA primase [Plantibacter flavus]SMG15086.1 DNA primase [Plantibacter flavus]
MAGRIRQSDVEEVKARTNIGDVVGDYVSLKSAGVGSLKGLCPFHDERSPSFHVRPTVGLYHCFGCGESGDVYSFLQKMDHVTFAESVERLAQRIGYPLSYEEGGGKVDHGNRARLFAANQAAAEYFQQQLHDGDADLGRRFLGERGFDAAAADHFGIGFAPAGWDHLMKALRSRGFSDEEMLAAGLVSSGDRGVYDRFRGRLIWPIRDTTGQVLGFGARRLRDDDKGPKYLNTPETAIYHKAQVLYGLDLAKRDISRGKRVVVVEGYTDVMACHLAGETTAVATCGTSFGVDHIKMIRRVMGDDSATGEVIFTFDPDEAGQKAATRAFGEEKRFSAQTYVAVSSDGLDPCDLRLNRGDGAIRKLVDGREPMFEFIIRRTLAGFDLETVEGRVGALRAAAPVVAEIRDPSLRPGYTRVLAKQLGMELDEVARAVRAAGGAAAGGSQNSARDARQQGPGAPAAEPPRERQASLNDLPKDPSTRLEQDALRAILQLPQHLERPMLERAVQSSVANSSLAVVRDAMSVSLDHLGTNAWLETVIAQVPPGFDGLVRELGVSPLPETNEEKLPSYVRDIARALIDRDLLGRKAALLGSLRRTDPRDESHREITRQLADVEAERRALRAEA